MPSNPTLKVNTPDHTIKSVTIFKSSKAEIVRTFSLNLKAGQNKVEIRGLPSTIDTHSVRVSGLGDARLFDVVCTIGVNNDASYFPDSSSEVIRLLRVKKAALESEKRVREHEADLLVNYAKTLSGEHVPPSQMSTFLESFVEQGRKNLSAVTEIGEKIIEVDRQIEKEIKRSQTKKGEAQGEVDIVLSADEASTVDLKLTYIVSKVSWHPTYELHATTENGKPSSSVALHYRARVTQSTGEDWTNTALTLSTVSSDTIAKSIPQLKPVKIQARTNAFAKNVGFNRFANVQPTFGQSFGQQVAQQQPQHESQHPGLLQLQRQQQLLQQLQQQQQQQQPAPSGYSLFGATGALFGGSHPQAPASGSFGASAPPAFNFSTSALGPFGATAPTTTSVPTGLFGASGASNPEVGVRQSPVSVEEERLEAYEEIDTPGAITEPTTFVTETPIAISFAITGESTIPSDGIEHQVSVAVLPFEAKISYVAIPRIEPRIYLQCQVQNTSEYRLLSGPVSVILDDSYVSKTSILDVNTGDAFDCTLGDDATTKVSYARSSRTVKVEGGSFTEATNTTTYTTKITIHNKHAFAVTDLIVRDAVPTSDDKRAKVILRKPEGLADAKDGQEVVINKEDGLKAMWEKLVDGKGGEKEGKFEWHGSVKAKDKVTLEAEWEVKGPADTIWVETRTV